MENISPCPSSTPKQPPSNPIAQVHPFSQEWVTITKEERIKLIHQANYWKAQHAQLKQKIVVLEEQNQYKDAKIKDLQNRLFGKKSEKQGLAKSEKKKPTASSRSRGQQPGSVGHGRTPRPDLPVILQTHDLTEEDKKCAFCGLPYLPIPALDECNEFIEVEVRAYTRRVRRPAYLRNPGCSCERTPRVITAPPLPRLIPRSPYQVSFWVEVLLSKFHYAQPTHRYLEDLSDQALPVSPGTVAGGLQKLVPMFKPIMDKFHQKQMTETLFHNDETRWEVFVEMEGKVGTRWYLWVTRSQSVIYFILDPRRSADVPGAHFAGLQQEQVIIVCDRYSAYKKLARLSDIILLAFCWAHVRRDFLDAGRSYIELEHWALGWKEHIGELYHRNRLRLECWNPERPIEQQTETFSQYHQSVLETLTAMHQKATRLTVEDEDLLDKDTQLLSKSARKQQRKVCQSLLNHWTGLTLFVENPQVPLDNNIAENTIRGPVTGRKNYYGSGSLWSATLAVSLFSILKTLVLWGINPRYWLTAYLTACAENNSMPPEDITHYLPWEMNEAQRSEFSRPPRSRVNDTS
jgi:transposase